jgi:polyphosphate kinase 2 (PPK2 family)
MLEIVTDLYGGNSWEAYQQAVNLMLNKTMID